MRSLILGRMSGLAVLPAWVVPPPGQVRDAHCIAAVRGELELDLRGVFAAFEWVTGGGPAPVTRRPEPLTPALVRAEMLLADLRAAGRVAELGDDVWAHLGVSRADAVVLDEVWAQGVALTLAWVLGAQRRPPVEIPRRDGRGAPMSAAQLYAEKAATRHFLPPEDRARFRAEAEREAARYRQLAALAASALT